MTGRAFILTWAFASIAWASFWIGRFSDRCFTFGDGSLVCRLYFLPNTDVVEGIFQMPANAYIFVCVIAFCVPVAILAVGWLVSKGWRLISN